MLLIDGAIKPIELEKNQIFQKYPIPLRFYTYQGIQKSIIQPIGFFFGLLRLILNEKTLSLEH